MKLTNEYRQLRLLARCAVVAIALGVSACGGGGDSSPTTSPGNGTGAGLGGAGGGQQGVLPDSATGSGDGFVAWMKSWINTKDDTNAPVAYGQQTVPVDNTGEAVRLR